MNNRITISRSPTAETLYNGSTISELFDSLQSPSVLIGKDAVLLIIENGIKESNTDDYIIVSLSKNNISVISIIKFCMLLYSLSMSDANEMVVLSLAKNQEREFIFSRIPGEELLEIKLENNQTITLSRPTGSTDWKIKKSTLQDIPPLNEIIAKLPPKYRQSQIHECKRAALRIEKWEMGEDNRSRI